MRYFIFLACLFLFSCSSSNKARKLLLAGELHRTDFKEVVAYEDFGGWIVVSVRFHGLEGTYDFLFDTGAPNVISTELAEKLNLKPLTKDRVGSSNSLSQKTAFSKIDTIYIGDLAFSNTGVIILDFDRSPDMVCLGKKVDGIIGSNLMRQAIWQINYQDQTLTITDDTATIAIPNQMEIPFKPKTQGTPRIAAQVNGVDFKLTVDTGKKRGIDLTAAEFKQVHKTFDTLRITRGFGIVSSGIFGVERDTLLMAKVPNVKIGAYELDTTVFTIKKKAGNLVGNDFLNNYIVTINWQNNRLYLAPVKDTTDITTTSFGFGYEFKNQNFYVSFLYEEGDAIKQGVQIGDQLLSIDGVSLENKTVDTFCGLKNDGITQKETKEVLLKAKRNEEILTFKIRKTKIF